jgi:hypothetical protein
VSVADLQFVPRNPGDWLYWGNQHWQDHQQIASAILTKFKITIWVPPLDPVPYNNKGVLETWHNWHGQLHLLMNNATGQVSNDLESVDVTNLAQLEAWVYLDWVEHQNNHRALGI